MSHFFFRQRTANIKSSTSNSKITHKTLSRTRSRSRSAQPNNNGSIDYLVRVRPDC